MRSKVQQIRLGHDIQSTSEFATYPGLNFLQVSPDGSVRHTYQDGENNFHLDTDTGMEHFLDLINTGARAKFQRELKILLNIV